MSYSIEPVDIKDPEVEAQLIDLIKDSFGMDSPISKGHLFKNTTYQGSTKSTMFFAAKEDGKIIGCNGFMSTDFIYNDKITAAYQSCWSATHPKHQGRKIFVNIINESKVILKDQGGAFIYGVPNNNSYPIFVKKLGFKEIPAVMVKIPNLPIIKNQFLEKQTFLPIEHYKKDSFLPVEEQIIGLKKNLSHKDVLVLHHGKSFIWGKLKTKELEFGVKLQYFYLGGMELNDVADLQSLINKIFSIYKIQYIQVVSAKSNLYNKLFKHWKPAQINGFIFFELNFEVENINMFYGAIDVF
jgi:hypothetical protein